VRERRREREKMRRNPSQTTLRLYSLTTATTLTE
jgi:hypothetical protein